jgi:hypothetical protein
MALIVAMCEVSQPMVLFIGEEEKKKKTIRGQG